MALRSTGLILHHNMGVVSTANMQSKNLLKNDLLNKDLLNSVNNQLTVVMAQAELLARDVESSQEVERCQKINQAACNITRLLQAYVSESKAAAAGS